MAQRVAEERNNNKDTYSYYYLYMKDIYKYIDSFLKKGKRESKLVAHIMDYINLLKYEKD